MIYFLDTNILLDKLPSDLDIKDCILSSETIKELEHIKTDKFKDDEIKFKARQAVRDIINSKPQIEIVDLEIKNILGNLGLEENGDNLILATMQRFCVENQDKEIVFLTRDYLAYLTAISCFGLKAELYNDKDEKPYKGYKVIHIRDEELAYFYEHISNNTYDCLINEYLILNTVDNKELCFKWNGEQYIEVKQKGLKSYMFGMVKPKDIFQRCAIDSLLSNDITVITGKAGSGKSHVALSYIMNMLDEHKYESVDVVHHFETLKSTKTLGYIKGDLTTKLLNTGSIGGILSSKFGDIIEVEKMMSTNVLKIIPTSNIRGVQFDNIIYVTEVQDIDTLTLKTIIQRCSTNSKLILEGDIVEQSDINRQSGMFRMIDVFKGDKSFGYVKLKHNYRNNIGNLADMM